MREIELNTVLPAAPKPLWEIPEIPSIPLGSFSLSTYPVMIGIGALGMLVCIWKRRERFSLAKWQCVVITILLTLCGIAGARLLYMLENLPALLDGSLSGNGVSFFGSVFLIPVAMPLVGWIFGLRFSQTNDLCAPCIAVMVGFIRIGCLLCGCCGGCVAYIGDYYFSWPTQIMESIGDFIIFFWLLKMERSGKYRGLLYPLLMLSYSALRSGIEFLRYSEKSWLGISNGHWFAVAAIICALIWISVYNRKNTSSNVKTKG